MCSLSFLEICLWLWFLLQIHPYVIYAFSEITNSYIYMLMECGNLDLNTWLRNRKAVNPLERKFYWKNMLEAVHTIHKHGSLSLYLSLLFPHRFSVLLTKCRAKMLLISNHCMCILCLLCRNCPQWLEASKFCHRECFAEVDWLWHR